MTNVKARLKKLEAAIAPPVPWRIINLIVYPNIKDINIRGYECEGITTMRLPGESVEDLKKRSIESAQWPDKTASKILHPIIDTGA